MSFCRHSWVVVTHICLNARSNRYNKNETVRCVSCWVSIIVHIIGCRFFYDYLQCCKRMQYHHGNAFFIHIFISFNFIRSLNICRKRLEREKEIEMSKFLRLTFTEMKMGSFRNDKKKYVHTLKSHTMLDFIGEKSSVSHSSKTFQLIMCFHLVICDAPKWHFLIEWPK